MLYLEGFTTVMFQLLGFYPKKHRKIIQKLRKKARGIDSPKLRDFGYTYTPQK